MGSRTGSHLFQKGVSGNPLGKPKGVKDNAVKRRFDFTETCFEEGFNPCLELIKIVRTSKSEHAKVTACSEIASYVMPKLKAIEITMDEAVEKFQLNFNVTAMAKDDRLLGNKDGE